jgi:hypothetical protein
MNQRARGNHRRGIWCASILLCSLSVSATQSQQPQVSIVFAILTKSIDSKSAAIGDEFVLRTLTEVVVDGMVVIPKESKLKGHVAGAIAKSKSEPESLITLSFDGVVTPDGSELPLQAIVAAIAAPAETLSSDPTYSMMHSNEPKMVGSGARPSGAGEFPATSKTASTAAVATAKIKGSPNEKVKLSADSQGAIGYEGMKIDWHLSMPPPLTVFSSKSKNVKLEAGTEMLLRMPTPRVIK